MKLSESISFNKQTLEFNGLVDLGQYTPEGKKNTRADHALVFMFQPFQGRWVQVLGCFLTKDSVTSAILHKLILDCIILLSNSGFHVDVVTTDGAQWNRAVWSIFGIEDGRFSCEHPCNRNKRLWMISDFPHLAKCFRNGLIRRRFIEVINYYSLRIVIVYISLNCKQRNKFMIMKVVVLLNSHLSCT